MIEDIHYPAPQPEDHNHEKDLGFRKDPEIYIEFGDGVFYQASLDGLEVAIVADYPRPYPYSIISFRRVVLPKSLLAPLSIELNYTL